MYGLDKETINHLFISSPKAQVCWSILINILKKNFLFPHGISNGLWLTDCQPNTSVFLKSIIAGGAQFIQKSDCNLIFNNEILDLHLITNRRIAHIKEFSFSPIPCNGKCLMLKNFSSTKGPSLFSVGTWKEDTNFGAASFLIVNHSFSTFLVGSYPLQNASASAAEAKALSLALDIIKDNLSSIQHIFLPNRDLHKAIHSRNTQHLQKADPQIKYINNSLLD